MPTRLPHAEAGVAIDEVTVGSNGHRADDFPSAKVMVVAPQGGLGAGRELFASSRVGQIRKADRNRLIEVLGAIGLDGDIERVCQAWWKRLRQPVGRHGRNPDPAATCSVICVKRVGRNSDADAGEFRILRGDLRWKGHRRAFCHADGLQRLTLDQWQVNDALAVRDAGRAACEVIVSACRGFPRLFDDRIIIALGPRKLRIAQAGCCRASVYPHKKAPGWARGQFEIAHAIRKRPHRFLGANHLNLDIGKGNLDDVGLREKSRRQIRAEDAADHCGPYDRNDADGIEINLSNPARLPVTVCVDDAIEIVMDGVSVKNYSNAGRCGKILQVEKSHRLMIRGEFASAKQLSSALSGVEPVSAENSVACERTREPKNRLACHRHAAFAVGWRTGECGERDVCGIGRDLLEPIEGGGIGALDRQQEAT